MAELTTTAPTLNMPGQIANPNAPGANNAALANLLNQVTNPTGANPNPVDLSALNQANPIIQQTDKKPETNLDEKGSKLQNFSRDLVSIGELVTSVPLVLSSFVSQAENISKYGKKVETKNTLSLIAYMIDVLSYIPRKFLNEIVSQRDAENENDVTDQTSKDTMFGDLGKTIPYPLRRLVHPNLSKEFSSLLFTFRRVIFNMFPNTFTVPSDEHDVEDGKKKNYASLFSKTVFETSARILSPFRWISSIAAAVTIIPANLFGVISAYKGNQQIYNISKEFSKLTELFTPIVSNLSSLYSSAKAVIDSYTRPNKESLSVSFGRYNISYLHMLQGSIGSLLSIPYFFGIFSRFTDILSSKDHNDKFLFENYIRELVGESASQIKSFGFFKNDSVAKMQDKVGAFVEKILLGVNKYPRQVLEALFNSSSFTKAIFSKIRPSSKDGQILARTGSNAFESETPAENYFFGLDKKIFFKEIFDLLHPIQSLLMLLPNAFVPLSDPYVADNAKRSLRIFDRMVGLNSIVLSVPNYLIYALSTRIPQMILKYHQMQFRLKDNKGISYDPNFEFNKTVNRIKNIPLLGTYLAGSLKNIQETKVKEYTFKDQAEMANLLEYIEGDARVQEASIKSSELVGAIRIGIRTLLGKGWFYASRDQETGYTDEDKSSMSIYNSLGTFKEGIYKFPVIGWIAGPFIEMIRRVYYVQPRTNLKRLSIA